MGTPTKVVQHPSRSGNGHQGREVTHRQLQRVLLEAISSGLLIEYLIVRYDGAPMKLISNKDLREFAALHADAGGPLQDFRRMVEKGSYGNFADLRAAFSTVDKVGPLYVFSIGGNKYRLVAALSFKVQALWVKAVLTHVEYDKEKWK